MNEKKIFKNPTEVLEEQINEIFLNRHEDKTDTIISALSIILNMTNSKNQDIIDLYNLVGMDTFVSLVSLFERRTITFPPKNEIKDAIILAMVFYYKETKKLSWEEVKEILPFEFSSISYSSKIKNLKSYIIENLRDIFEEEEKKEEKNGQ